MTQNTQTLLGAVDPEILDAVNGRAREIAQGASALVVPPRDSRKHHALPM